MQRTASPEDTALEQDNESLFVCFQLPGEASTKAVFLVVDAPYVHVRVWPLTLTGDSTATIAVDEWRMQVCQWTKVCMKPNQQIW